MSYAIGVFRDHSLAFVTSPLH